MSQDIRVGDVLIGDDGTRRTVLETFGGEDELYRVDQKRGISYVVNSKHKLLFKYSGEGVVQSGDRSKVIWFDREQTVPRSKQFDTREDGYAYFSDLRLSDAIEMTVDEYIKTKDGYKKSFVAWKAADVHWDGKDVSMDPYILGAWLGDGFSNGSGIAGKDTEVIGALADWCDVHGAEVVHGDKYTFRVRRAGTGTAQPLGRGTSESCKACKKARFALCDMPRTAPQSAPQSRNPFLATLRSYDLVNNKHIPIDYLTNDRETRLQLLAGVIDTDGWVGNGGKRVTIIQSNETVAKDVETLARSLGFNVNVTTRELKNVALNVAGVQYEPKDYKTQHVINVSGTRLYEVPTRIARKACAAATPNKDELATGFSVTPIGRGRYFGWTVDGNRRFLLGDFTVVRNCDQASVFGCLSVAHGAVWR